MNFLAHVYLSGDDKQVQVGNFIGDFVKGSAYKAYPPLIAAGILLHRAIDDFTDRHPKVQEAKRLLRPEFGLYSGIFLDMYYDHFLAANWSDFSAVSLKQFTRQFYWAMVRNYRILPKKVQGFLPHLILSNRLYAYSTLDGLKRSLEIMESHTSLPKKSGEAIDFLCTSYDELKRNFYEFFPDLQRFAADKIVELI